MPELLDTILKVVKIDPPQPSENFEDFTFRLTKKINGVSEEIWGALGQDAQEWHNEAILKVRERRALRKEGKEEEADEIELPALHVLRLARADVGHGFCFVRFHNAGLMLCRQEAVAEEAHATVGCGGTTALQHDVAGQVARLGAQPIARPRTRTRVAEEGEAGVHEEIALCMLAELGRHAPELAEFIHHAADLRKEIAHLQS